MHVPQMISITTINMICSTKPNCVICCIIFNDSFAFESNILTGPIFCVVVFELVVLFVTVCVVVTCAGPGGGVVNVTFESIAASVVVDVLV